MYVGMEPMILRIAISFLYISFLRCAEVMLQRSGWDQVCDATWWPSSYIRLLLMLEAEFAIESGEGDFT